MAFAQPLERPGDAAARSAEASARPFVSIVMPCLNEEQTVEICVRKALGWLQRSGTPGEVVIVDNGSTDRSVELATAAGARVVHESRRGYGAALRRGFAEARGEWLVMGDCDDTYEFSDLDALMRPLDEGYDLSVGNRHAGGIAPGAMTWSHRYIGTPTISFLLKMFTGLKVGDSQCGLRAFTRDALNRLDLKTDGMELASEMILKAARRDLKVADVPVPYGERLGEAKLNTVRDGWRHLRFLLLASPNYLFTFPGILPDRARHPHARLRAPQRHHRDRRPDVATDLCRRHLRDRRDQCPACSASRRGSTPPRAASPTKTARCAFTIDYLGFETFILTGIAFVLLGIGLDVIIAIQEPAGVSTIGLMAIAQTLIIAGANIALVGAMCSLLEEE